ncbi:Choline-phosphate cytidylyltransferase B [Myotis davidii]|uniref:Choline-phosphate cytidylyltransferase B n=1 Tax=Myotis davidii TaxID=225400 RepID=L5LHJ8_MYODS|nr:Choline-phosphate cytidylyltransferase B [Myotis davidii]
MEEIEHTCPQPRLGTDNVFGFCIEETSEFVIGQAGVCEIQMSATLLSMAFLPAEYPRVWTLTAPAPFADEVSCQCQAPHEKLTIAQARLGTPVHLDPHTPARRATTLTADVRFPATAASSPGSVHSGVERHHADVRFLAAQCFWIHALQRERATTQT